MDPNNQNPQPTPSDAAADNAALDAVNKLDQESPAPADVQPVMDQPAPATAPVTPEQPMTPAPSSNPMPTQDTQPATPSAAPIGGSVKKTSSTTKILVIVLIVAFLALAGFMAWQFFTTGRLI